MRDHLFWSDSNRSAEYWLNAWSEGLVDLSASYQRGYCWTDEIERPFLRSFLFGVPIGSFIVNDRFHGANESVGLGVIDGKQRLRSIFRLMTSEIAVPACWFNKGWSDPINGEITLEQTNPVTIRKVKNLNILSSFMRLDAIEDEAKIRRLITGEEP